MDELIDLVWLAGIIDGEGSIYVMVNPRKGKVAADGYMRKRDNHILRVKIQSTDSVMAPEAKRITGEGAVFLHKELRENQRDTLVWEVSGRKAARILEKLLPYLRVKQAQAKLGIEFQSLKKHWKHCEEIDYQDQARLAQDMKKLNLVGRLAPQVIYNG